MRPNRPERSGRRGRLALVDRPRVHVDDLPLPAPHPVGVPAALRAHMSTVVAAACPANEAMRHAAIP